MGFSGLRSLITDMEAHPGWQARRQFRQVIEYWPKAVGYSVARQTKPVSIRRHVLYVTVSNASWAQTLTLERRRVLHKLNRLLAMPLEDIRFSSAQWHTRPIPRQQLDNDWVSTHPSYVGQVGASPGSPVSEKSKTAEAAYELWATVKKKQQKMQDVCPECSCACPPGELVRWSMCSLCIAKTW